MEMPSAEHSTLPSLFYNAVLLARSLNNGLEGEWCHGEGHTFTHTSYAAQMPRLQDIVTELYLCIDFLLPFKCSEVLKAADGN